MIENEKLNRAIDFVNKIDVSKNFKNGIVFYFNNGRKPELLWVSDLNIIPNIENNYYEFTSLSDWLKANESKDKIHLGKIIDLLTIDIEKTKFENNLS